MKLSFRQLILNDSNRILVSGATQSFVLRVISLLLTFLLNIYLARILGANGYGNYVYVLTWINVLLLLGMFGFDSTGKKYVSIYDSSDNYEKLDKYIRYSYTFVFKTSFLLCLLIIFLIRYVFSPWIHKQIVDTFYWGAVLLPINSLLSVSVSTLRGFKKIVSALYPQIVLRPALILIFVFCANLSFAKSFIRPSVVMAMNVFATVIALLFILFHLRNALPKKFTKKPIQPSEKSEWLLVALPLLLISGLHLILSRTDLLMLGMLSSTREAGIYGASARIAELILFGLYAVNIIAAPLIADLFAARRYKELQHTISTATLGIALFSYPVAIFITLGSKWLLGFFGMEFITGKVALMILSFGHIVNISTGTVSLLMTMTGHEKSAVKVLIGAITINILGNLIFIPRYGMEGAAVATMLSTLFWNVGLYLYVKIKLNIDSSIFGAVVYLTGQN